MSVTFHAMWISLLIAIPPAWSAQQDAAESVHGVVLPQEDGGSPESLTPMPATLATNPPNDPRRAAYRIDMNRARRNKERQQYVEAAKYYQSAYNAARGVFGDLSEEARIAVTLLAEMQLKVGHLADANRSFHSALAILESHPNARNFDKALVLNGLAAVQHMLGNVAKAADLMRQAVGMFESDSTASRESFGGALSNLATTLRDVGNVPEAMKAAQRAVSILESCRNSDNFAISLVTLGQVDLDSGDPAAAEAAYQRALKIVDSLSKEDTPTRALVFTHLGVLYGKTGRGPQAESYFSRAVGIYRRLFSPEHPVLLDSMTAYATFLRAAKRRAEARKLEAYVRDQREKYRQENPSVAYVVDASSLRAPGSR